MLHWSPLRVSVLLLALLVALVSVTPSHGKPIAEPTVPLPANLLRLPRLRQVPLCFQYVRNFLLYHISRFCVCGNAHFADRQRRARLGDLSRLLWFAFLLLLHDIIFYNLYILFNIFE